MRTGRCLCGAVTFRAERLGPFGVCHCRTCQLWTGGPFLGVNVPRDAMTHAGPVAARRTSGWASRARCGACGSPLWYRWDRGADDAGDYEVPLGLFDDRDGLAPRHEIFTADKPDMVSFAGERPRYAGPPPERAF